MIVIIDYGMGNLSSVKNALEQIGVQSIISNDPKVIEQAKGLILPGVGAFKEAMDNLNNLGLVDIIKEQTSKKPFLGICLGMQLLFEQGFEVEKTKGLGLLKGNVILMKDETIKIPHIGFNKLEINKENSLIKDNMFVYFVHSYYASDIDENNLIAYSTYGNLKIPAIVSYDNVIGCQFHPEKSGTDGLYILKKFKELLVWK